MNKRSKGKCDVFSCDRPERHGGFCHVHYKAFKAGAPLVDLPPRGANPVRYEALHAVVETRRKGVVIDVLVSLVDVDLVKPYHWVVGKNGYAYSHELLMHRVIMKPPPEVQVDHINGNRLDNRRENLRLVTRAENQQNIWRDTNTTGHRNVHWCKQTQSYSVRVVKNHKPHWGGRHKNLDDAIEAARKLRDQLFTHHNEDRAVYDNAK